MNTTKTVTPMTKKEEFLTIAKIAKRAKAMGHPDDLLTINMDVENVHLKHPLRLQELFDSDNGNFAHDVFGIRQHINRETGELENCFSPRYTV